MGARANFIILEDKSYKIYFAKWDAPEVPRIFSQGLEFCENYFKTKYNDDYLMDNAFAEGGILIDKDSKYALLFSDDEYTPAIRRVFLEEVQKFWKGWNIQWCEKGIISIAEYLGIFKEQLLAEGCTPEFDWYETKEIDNEFKSNEVITIIHNNKIQDYYVDTINFGLAKGPKLKELINQELLIKNWKNEVETDNVL